MRIHLAAIVIALALAAAAPARAETLLEPPRQRQGYYFAAGLSLVLDHNWKDGKSVGTWPGQLFGFGVGQLLTPRFGLGLHIDFGGAKSGTRTSQIVGLGVEGQWELARNIAVHGVVGLGVVGLRDSANEDEGLEGTAGAGYTLWLSYDWFLGRRRTGGWALTPIAGARFLPGSDDARALIGFFGLELTYWTGLPRNQLDLPPNEAW
jgi:hypothetical protein